MTQPSSRLNPHRSLVALDGEGSTSTGVASLRGRNGESLHVRVVQSQEREDLNMHRVRWVFTEGSETFQVDAATRANVGDPAQKIYVTNRQLQDADQVGAAGLAARSGLRVGDVILSINDTPVYEHGGAIRSVDVATGSFDVVFIPVDDSPCERQLHPMEA